jgi:predicted amidohydrolase
VAGTYFNAGKELRNRALVFDERGRLIHRQDKSFLTPYEEDLLGVSPGAPRAVEAFEVSGFDVAITICRDSFFSVWDRRFAQADLWLELRANGEEYGPAVRERFDGALPERVAAAGVPVGVSSSLNGEFLDLVWEGPAYVVNREGRRVDSGETPRGTDIIYVDVRKTLTPK